MEKICLTVYWLSLDTLTLFTPDSAIVAYKDKSFFQHQYQNQLVTSLFSSFLWENIIFWYFCIEHKKHLGERITVTVAEGKKKSEGRFSSLVW